MLHSGIALTPEMDKSYAMPYAVSGEKTDRWIVSGIEAAGAVRSCAEDMLRYARFNLGKGNQAADLSHRLLSPTHLPTLGMFWLRRDCRTGGLCLNHEGGTGGFSTHLLLLPERACRRRINEFWGTATRAVRV
jgi:CubicO group peptidase (beta-lactamase class C family)